MSAPIPAPRTLHNENKKPVPTPRRLIPIVGEKISENKKETSKDWEVNFNTFSRRVRTLSNTSKQITEEIAGRVQEKKKQVIEGTRQSVRKITRRFTTPNDQTPQPEVVEDDRRSESGITDIFNSITFQSPIPSETENSSIYTKTETSTDYDSSEESISLPPPLHPPPPLREDSIYDQPQSLASGSTNSNSSESVPIVPHNPSNYESVFPIYPYNSDTDSCLDVTAGTLDKHVSLLRSESFNYYDPVAKTEPIYNNVDSTPVLEAVVNADETDLASHIDVRNALYENHTIKPPPRTKKLNKRSTDSVMLQFDPLNNIAGNNYSNVTDLQALEELLQGELYGSISNVGTFDNWSISTESEVDEYFNPPTPPTRFDSLPEESSNQSEKTKSNWFVADTNLTKPAASNNNIESKAINWFKQVNEVLKKAPEIVKGNKQKNNVLMRPMLSMKAVLPQKGMLYKVTSGPVEDLFGEFTSRWCILESGYLTCFADASNENIKENFSMDSILSVQALVDQKYKYKYDNEELHCFEVNVSGKSRGGHVYGSQSISERRIWMQRLAECLYSKFPVKAISDYSRIGWAYIREGVSGEWIGAWLVLSQRKLYYALDKGSPKNIDLRKARCIVLQSYQDNEVTTPRTNDKGPNLLIDCPSGVIYLRMWTTKETKTWCHVVRLAAHNNGALLEQQQLTKNDIPVIVEKCINFIYAHGSMTEGIYRKAGSGSTVLDVLTQFRRDAYAVQLTLDKYNEHDIATALKRFFRDLPEPLLTSSNRQYLYQVSLVKIPEEKIRMFRGLFDHFSPIAQKTVRRLLSHLHFISTQSKRNLMTADNLATVWGPTLMFCDEKDESVNRHNKEFAVVSQLISLYRNIFPENPEEIEQERIMLQVLEKCMKSPQGPVNTKASGDLRVWVYLYNKEGQTYNVAISPQKTAYQVCLELSAKAKLGVHELQLEEHVLNDHLLRPIHHAEKVLDVVLRWGYWDESDRKDNALVLSSISKYWEYIQEKPLPVSGELKYADCKSKAFKLYTFEFAQAKLSYYKDKTCSTKLSSWNIEDILWYIGHEPKRNPQSNWTITFISKSQPPKRIKSSPWFGNILAWSNPGLRASWLAAMMKAEHPKDLMPPPQHVNLMSN